MSRKVNLFKGTALIPFAALALLLSPAGAAQAQSSQSARDARRNEIETHQRALWDLEKLKKEPREKAQGRRPAYRDVESEFEHLQLANYALAGLLAKDAAIDYVSIRKTAAEVNKSAERLKTYLLLPKPDNAKKQKKSADALSLDGLRPAVASLDALVNGFVWNPVFRQADVVDSEKSMKASRDLEEIIDLSERIRKSAEDLMKRAAQK